MDPKTIEIQEKIYCDLQQKLKGGYIIQHRKVNNYRRFMVRFIFKSWLTFYKKF